MEQGKLQRKAVIQQGCLVAQLELDQVFFIKLAQVWIQGTVSVETTGLVTARHGAVEQGAGRRDVFQGDLPAPE